MLNVTVPCKYTYEIDRLIFRGSFAATAQNLLCAINICIRPFFLTQIHTQTHIALSTMQIMLAAILSLSLSLPALVSVCGVVVMFFFVSEYVAI